MVYSLKILYIDGYFPQSLKLHPVISQTQLVHLELHYFV